MKITILQGAFLPVPTLRGGATEKMWFELGKQFFSKGHTVTHISRRFPGLPTSEIIDGVKHVRIKGYDWPANPLAIKFFDLIYTLRSLGSLPQADILITNTFWAPILASRFQFRFGKIVVDVARIPKGQMRFYHSVACLRANSSSVKNAILAEAPHLANKVAIIPNPLPYNPPPLKTRKTEQIILFCGRIHPEKGIELLLRAFELACQRGLRNWSLRLVGSADVSAGGGGSAWINQIVKKFESDGLPVEWLGPLYNEQELQDQYSRAPIFAYPSIADNGESFGMAPLEAMAFGGVPIVSSIACFQDFITPGVNGLIFDHRSPNSVSLLSTAILQLVSDPSLCDELSSVALKVRQSHHPSAIADEFLKCFASLQ
jgi:glycosyltransferase involved in cell wall biosynthesis